MKIGILTYHRSINYGAFLQAYALQKYVMRIAGKTDTVEIIDYHSKKAQDIYTKTFWCDGILNWEKYIQYMKFKLCLCSLTRSKKKLISDDLHRIQKFIKELGYDIIIVGSDEIWKIDGMRGFPNAYWLNYDIGTTQRVSFAASSRAVLSEIEDKQKKYISEALNGFSYVGVRDVPTFKMANSAVSYNKVYLNCDPTFLYDFSYNQISFKERLRRKYKLKKNQKLIGIMMPDEELCKMIKKRLGNSCCIFSLLDKNKSADYNLIQITPFEWARVIGAMDMMVTNRFHGTVFAIKYSVPFLALDDYDKQPQSKIYDLLTRIGLDNFYFSYQGVKTRKRKSEAVEEIFYIISNNVPIDNKEIVKKERERAKSFARYINRMCYNKGEEE